MAHGEGHDPTKWCVLTRWVATAFRGIFWGDKAEMTKANAGTSVDAEHHPSDEDASTKDAAGTRQVARGGLANLIGAAYAGLASFAITALVARIASTEDAGIYFAAVSVLLIAVALCELGIPVGYVYFMARYRALGNAAGLRKILVAGAIPVGITGIVIMAVAFALLEPLGTMFFGTENPNRAVIMAVLASALLIAITADSALGATRGLGVMRPTVVADKFVNPTVQLLALVLLAIAGWTGGEQLIWTRVVGFAAVAIIAVPWLAKLLRRFPHQHDQKLREKWMPTRSTWKEFWRFTGPRAVGQMAQVGIQRVDIVLVALLLGPSEAAIYAAATRFLVFGQLAANAIGTAVQPRISTLAARGQMGLIQDLYRTSTAWVMFATWPFYLSFIVYSNELMLVFGPDYASGALVLQILSAAMLVATGCGAVDAVLLMAGRSTLTMINAWIALVVNIGLNVVLIPIYGIFGAALAWVSAILVMNVVPLIQVRVTLGVHPFGRPTLLAVMIPMTLFGIIPWIVSIAGGGLWGAFVCLVVTGAIYAGLLWRLRLSLGLVNLVGRRRSGAR